MAWGSELIIDMRAGEKLLISNKEYLEGFAKKLVDAIGMIAYGDPIAETFGEGNKAGFTLVQLITTSNITGHFCDETGDGYINIFSCKDIDIRAAIECVFDSFHPAEVNYLVIDRQAGEPIKVITAGHAREVVQIEPNTVVVDPTPPTPLPPPLIPDDVPAPVTSPTSGLTVSG